MKTINRMNACAVKHYVLLIAIACCYNTFLYAQSDTSNNNNEAAQAIRILVAQQNDGVDVIKYTDDRIFVSGAYPMPVIGKAPLSAANAEADQKAKARKNFTSKFRIERLEVAQAGDMAYEFGYVDVNFDTPGNKHESFEASYIRIWRKIQGDWKVDVFFGRRNEK